MINQERARELAIQAFGPESEVVPGKSGKGWVVVNNTKAHPWAGYVTLAGRVMEHRSDGWACVIVEEI